MSITETNQISSRAIIAGVKKSKVVATGEKFIEVELDIYEGDEKVETRKLGYPYDTSEEEIEAEIKKLIELRDSEKVQNEEQLAVEEEEASVDNKVSNLESLEIN